MRSYRPEELLRRRRAARRRSWPRWRRAGDRRMGANPHANGGRLLVAARAARLRATTRSPVDAPGDRARRDRRAGSASCCATSTGATTTPRTSASSAPTRPTRNRLGAVFEVENRCLVGRDAAIDDHVVARRPGDGGAQRAPLPGLARGLPADRPARAVRHLRGVRDGLRVDDRPAHQVAAGGAASCRGARRSPSLNILLTSTCWRNDHNGFSHQGPGPDRHDALACAATVVAHLPAARRQLPARRSPTTACAAATTST